MKWYRLYKESDEQVNLKKLLKLNGVTKLPSGTEFKPDRISWSKDGGYAGQKTLKKICSQLEDAGWKRGEWRTGGVPDGSSVSNSNAYTSPDGQIVMTYFEHFGATAHDNFYGFTFKMVENPVNESRDDMVATLVKIDGNGEEEIESKQVSDYWDAMKLLEDYATEHSDDDEWVAEKYAKFMSGEDEHGKDRHVGWLAKNGKIDEEFIKGGYTIELRVKESDEPDYSDYEQYGESSRFGFKVGDEVELKDDVEPNRFSGREAVPAGTVGEVVAIDKPMRGVIKVKIEDGKVVSVPERKLKFSGTDNEPWEKYKTPEKPPRKPDPETLARQRPEWIYMEPPKPGYPKWTGD